MPPPEQARGRPRLSVAGPASLDLIASKSPNNTATVPDQRPDVRQLVEHLDHIQHRVVQEVLAESTASYWRKRAEAFRAALPRQDEWHGREGLASVRARRDRLKAVVAACEARAEVALWQDGEPDVV